MWYARNQVLEHAHQVPEKVYADQVRVFRDALERRWEQRGWRRVLQDAEVQHEQELQCFGLLCASRSCARGEKSCQYSITIYGGCLSHDGPTYV